MTAPEEQQAREVVKTAARAIVETINKLLLSPPNLSGAADQYRHVLERGQLFNKRLSEANLSMVPAFALTTLKTQAERSLSVLNRLKDFTFVSVGSQERDQEWERLGAQLDNQYKETATHLAVVSDRPLESDLRLVQTMRDETLAFSEEGATARAIAKKDIETKLKEIEDILEKARTTVAEEGASREAKHFEDLAKTHRTASKRWLACAGLAGLLVFGVVIYLLDPYRKHDDTNQAPQAQGQSQTTGRSQAFTAAQATEHILSRVAILSLVTTALWFCLRNYSASRHNHIVNEHRAVALRTFQAFVAGSSSPEVKATILLQASNAAFSAQGTGYVKDEGEIPHIVNLAEVVKSMINKA